MKNITGILLLLSISLSSFAQERDYSRDGEMKTLFGNNRYSSGGYGGFGAGYTVMDGKDAIVMSGRGAWIIGHSLGIGIAGAGFINDFHYNPQLDADVNLSGGYGGLLIEPIVLPKFPVHLAFPVIAGVGGMAYTRTDPGFDPWDYNDSWVEDTEVFLILEPGVELEFNLLRFFRLAVGGSYRFTSAISLYDTPSDVLQGFTGGVTFKFGRF